MGMRALYLTPLFAILSFAQSDDYHGPTPPKSDVPYLLHASTLVPTEATEAHSESKKGDQLYWVDGEASTAKTPLAEPIFIIKIDKLIPEKIELYKFDVNKKRRELVLKDRPGRNDAHPLHVQVTRLGKGLYKIEVSETLPNGEYSLSPQGSDTVFAFQVY
jgi:hypothetical protein